ncbi:hypothetical protein EDB84DRAFT_1440509 [Lactarius hengduanensis]|nr:hypothetical protein EDB84DRAFT_1440509 [Lactarius hengduanensis]
MSRISDRKHGTKCLYHSSQLTITRGVEIVEKGMFSAPALDGGDAFGRINCHWNYRLWGPSTRTCLMLTRFPRQIVVHSRAVHHTADRFTSHSKQFLLDLDVMTVPDSLFTTRPIHEGDDANTEFGTDHIAQIVAHAYAKHDNAVRLSFYKAMSGHMWFAASAGYLLENYMLLWFSDALAAHSLHCTLAKAGSAELKIPVCGKNQKFFSSVAGLKGANSLKPHPYCLIPVSQRFTTADAIVLTDEFVITVQVTVSSTHDAKEAGFDSIYSNFPRQVDSHLTLERLKELDLERAQDLENEAAEASTH